MKVLIIGSGGREHTLVWKIHQSPLVDKIYCAPGNGGISEIAECIDIKAEDIDGLLRFAKEKAIDLTVVGPEAPLVEGIVDVFEKEGLKIFGPNAAAARLEGSKTFSKEMMEEFRVPTAPFETFEDALQAKNFVAQAGYPLVIKADGLAAGKGVIICQTADEAVEAIDQIMVQKVFQEAGQKIVIEQCLVGEEVSILAISDGENHILLDSSQDHKRIFDEDLGPNTGGMGAYSPAPILNRRLHKEIEARIISPMIKGMKEKGTPFKGVLYAGLMITEQGPFVLEFNVRFGDPEAQAVLPRMKNDLIQILLASCEGTIDEIMMDWDQRHCVCVVMSSGGYPGKYDKGKEITGLDQVKDLDHIVVFHAGTKKEDQKLLTSGGRVLGVTGLGEGIEGAIDQTYKAVETIQFDRCFFRRDIGAKALKKMNV